MKVSIPADRHNAREIANWLDDQVGPWRDGHWRVRTRKEGDGTTFWEIECDDAGATLFMLRWA